MATEVIVLKGEPILSSTGHNIKLHPKQLCFYLYICATLKLDQRSFLLHWWWLTNTYITIQTKKLK